MAGNVPASVSFIVLLRKILDDRELRYFPDVVRSARMRVHSRASAGRLLDHPCDIASWYDMSRVSLNVLAAACCEMTDRLLQQSTIVGPIQPTLFSTRAKSAVSHAQVAFQHPPPTIGLEVDER